MGLLFIRGLRLTEKSFSRSESGIVSYNNSAISRTARVYEFLGLNEYKRILPTGREWMTPEDSNRSSCFLTGFSEVR